MSNAAAPQALPPRVTADNALVLLRQLERVLGGASRIQIDCAALTQFDSSVLSLLLALRRRALAAGKVLEVRNPSANLRKLAGLYGIDELLLMPVAAGSEVLQ